MKKLTVLLLAALCSLMLFAGCTDNNKDGDTDMTPDTNQTDNQDDTTHGENDANGTDKNTQDDMGNGGTTNQNDSMDPDTDGKDQSVSP